MRGIGFTNEQAAEPAGNPEFAARHEVVTSYRINKLSLYSLHAIAISVYRTGVLFDGYRHRADRCSAGCSPEEEAMKVWTKPAVREQEVGLEVTSYLPAEIDVI